VTSASHNLALAWHPVLSSSSPLLSSFLSLDVYIHTQTELIAFRSSAPGRDKEFGSSKDLSIKAQQAALFYKCIRETMHAVAFIAIQGGLIGLAPPSTQQGGLIAIVNGLAYPFVVRLVQGAGFYLLRWPVLYSWYYEWRPIWRGRQHYYFDLEVVCY
jgi:hypothetical protein